MPRKYRVTKRIRFRPTRSTHSRTARSPGSMNATERTDYCRSLYDAYYSLGDVITLMKEGGDKGNSDEANIRHKEELQENIYREIQAVCGGTNTGASIGGRRRRATRKCRK